ncbi:MAG: DUF5107 domain-containing protein [Gemmatimonadaceae bacterium]|nr:DUF5107 domain-containing protein [Gemmatimonadaceae bacterium]
MRALLRTLLAMTLCATTPAVAHAAPPVVREYEKVFTTYPFSDPNPIPVVGRIYPYFRFDGFTDTPVRQSWKVVELENDYLKVMILPQVGGKIWSAIDKRSGRSFIYANSVVKFRDIAMRGPWTSGGIEANYGIIGHTPNVATPVDYVTRTNADGSVSCIIGALDLLTRTPWRLEVRLGADDAAFSTSSSWYNASPLEQPYYSWMNAGIPVDGKLQYIYPGTSYLGHGGEHGPWPVDSAGRDLSWYDNNSFGGYKSYHVFGTATDFFGAYWHDRDFGMVRWSPRDEKAGKKIWIWGQSRQGMIWEDLLTDTDGQYSEVQSGRLFNQAAEQSTFTPFRHRGFAPHTTDRWTEWWYPVSGTKGMVAAGRTGALNVTTRGAAIVLTFSPTVPVADTLRIYDGARLVRTRFVSRQPLQLWADTIATADVQPNALRVTLGDVLLDWRADPRAGALARPLDAPAALDWSSAVGLHAQGRQWIRQREYLKATAYADSALARDPHLVPALADRAMLAIRAGQYADALRLARTALSVDTYDPAANYWYGLANRWLRNTDDARDGLEIAANSPEFRGAAWTELARLSLAEANTVAAESYVAKALAVDGANLDALGMAIVAARRRGDSATRDRRIAALEAADPISHQARVERMLASNDAAFASRLAAGIRAELPEQVLLELGSWYAQAGEAAVAGRVLEAAGDHPEALYLRAWLRSETGDAGGNALIERAGRLSPGYVFPFRAEVVPALEHAARISPHWQPRYYLALARWGQGNLRDAARILTSLADQPDYAPFYAARATLPERSAADCQRDLERAAALEPAEWRYGKLLADHLIANGNAAAAVEVAARYHARFPASYILGLTHAKALVAAGQYAAADALLGRLSILPYEGAADGRLLYREAKLMLAAQAIAAGRWRDASRQVAAAREWPERLGAGKPYAADVDERLEDTLQAHVKARRVNRDAPAMVQAALHPGTQVTGGAGAPSDSLRHGVGTWIADSLGNHRAVVRVANAADAVVAHIPWRRRDATPQSVNLVVIQAATQQRIRNVARLDITREAGDIAFQAPAAGEYHVYYLPYTGTFKSNYPKITYRVVEPTAEPTWLSAHGLNEGAVRSGALNELPRATMVGFDAVNEFSRFTPMEYIATASELAALRGAHPSAPFLAFAEDRALSIRMTRDIPAAWAQRGAFTPFTGTARRGEFYTFQVGVWAHRGPLDSLRYRMSALRRKGGSQVIPSRAITAFNLEGTDWSGRRFTRALHVDSSRVQALWFGVDLPAAITPGDYEGDLRLVTATGSAPPVRVTIRVGSGLVANHGDDTPAQLTRLRWLNSQLAADDSVVAPYVPMRVSGTTISLLGRALTFGNDGMPVSIQSFFSPGNTSIGTTPREILSAPIRLVVRDSADRAVAWTGADPVITKRAPGAVAWEARKSAGALRLQTNAVLEFDGTAEYTVALKASARTSLRTVTFELPLRADAARYMMGLGQKGGYRPEDFHWTWDVAKQNQDAAWLGDVNAGIQFTLKDEHYVRPLNTNFYLSKPLVAPRSWANDGKGGCDIVRTGDRVLASCHSGAQVIEAGDSLRFDFRLMITPFKPLDTAGQWSTRFFHAFVPVDSAKRRGANTLNVHHANRVNPWINYPFIETAGMRAFIDSAHAAGMRAKIYYTVRELTNHAPELFALRSLGDEVLSHGPGGGYSWLQEHLGDDYIAAWHVPEITDAAVVNSGVSRWHNFYIEGLDWLVKNERIDGLYLDDVAFDRITMKRVRKVLDRGNASALLDLHSANQYNPRDGFASSANLYLEHFPFINRLWFGEYFDYDARPDYWLVEVSGIPFGLMGEMLEKGGHPWRGMTMGMTARLPWAGDPTPLWKVWDEFGIQQSRMHGWWSGAAPVTTGDADILATTWTKPGSAMVSLGSWKADDTPVRLTIDWQALGLDPARTRIRAPAIANFQAAGTYDPGAPITVPGKRGLLLILEPSR